MSILDNIALALFSLAATLLIWWYQARFLSIIIPKYIIESVEWGRFAFSLRCKLESVCFVSDLKRTTPVLLTLRQILFAFSQLFKFFKLSLTCLFIFLMKWLGLKNVNIISKMHLAVSYCIMHIIYVDKK